MQRHKKHHGNSESFLNMEIDRKKYSLKHTHTHQYKVAGRKTQEHRRSERKRRETTESTGIATNTNNNNKKTAIKKTESLLNAVFITEFQVY